MYCRGKVFCVHFQRITVEISHKIQGFLFIQISGNNLIKIQEVLNIFELQDNFCKYSKMLLIYPDNFLIINFSCITLEKHPHLAHKGEYGVSFVSVNLTKVLSLELLCCLNYRIIYNRDISRVHIDVNFVCLWYTWGQNAR